MKIDLSKLPMDKIGRVVACVGAGVMAAIQLAGEQKKEAEIEAMKKELSELKEKRS